MATRDAPVTEELGPFFDLAPDLLAVIDGDGTIVAVNAAVRSLLGWQRDELVGRPWTDVVHPSDVAQVLDEARRMRRTGEPSEAYEVRLRRRDGGFRWFQSSATPALERDVVYTISVDIDERRRDRDRLLARADAVDAVLDSLSEAVLACDRDGVLTYLNRAAIERFGMEREPVPADRWVEHFAIRRPDGTPITIGQAPLYRALHGEVVHNVELLIRPPGVEDDIHVLVNGQPLVDPRGERYGGVIALNDVTAHVRTERALRELRIREVASRQRARYLDQLRGLARASVELNSELEFDEMLETITEHAAAIIGARRAVGQLSVGNGPEGEELTVRLAGGVPVGERDEDDGDLDDGRETERWLAAPLIGRSGGELGVIRVADKVDGAPFTEADESILVQLAQMAAAAVEKARVMEFAAAQEAARFREELLAGISHDMQTPLAAIVGLSDVLLLDEDDTGERGRMIDTIGRQARSLRRLVQQFLDYSRLEADRPLVINPRPTDVTAIVDRVVGLFEHLREFVVGADADLPPVVVDPDRLEQVLANLVSNAVKFSDAPVRVVARRSGDRVVIDVIDEGPGIGEDEVAGLFGKFHRGSNAERLPGSGLGLYISKAVVEAHDGTLTATSRPGFGSRFRVSLPAGS